MDASQVLPISLGKWHRSASDHSWHSIGSGLRLQRSPLRDSRQGPQSHRCIHILSATGTPASEVTWSRLGFNPPPRERKP
jgi:hypothetical protein